MYAILSECNKESNKAKGVNISIDFSEYKDILFTGKTIRHRKKRIQSKKHKNWYIWNQQNIIIEFWW